MTAHTTSPDQVLDASAAIPQHVVYRSFPAETVVLNLETGRYHGLNPIGGRMLAAIEAAPTVRAAAALLADEFMKPLGLIEQDLRSFCTSLSDRGLIRLNI